MDITTPSGPLFEKLPAELKSGRLEALSVEVKATLQLLIDADIQAGGEVTAGTLEAIATQGYAIGRRPAKALKPLCGRKRDWNSSRKADVTPAALSHTAISWTSGAG